jgi:starvation-inducible outer membrane lipoprotein
MASKRTRVALYVMVRDADTDPEIVARQVYEEAIKPFVDKRYDGRVLAIPVGDFTDMPATAGGPVDDDGEDR